MDGAEVAEMDTTPRSENPPFHPVPSLADILSTHMGTDEETANGSGAELATDVATTIIALVESTLSQGRGALLAPIEEDGTLCGEGMHFHPGGCTMRGELSGQVERIRNATVTNRVRPTDGSTCVRGDIVSGHLNGDVTIRCGSCNFQGTMDDGVATGRGEWHGEDGVTYEGEWRAGKRDGHGVASYGSDAMYSGQWRHDLYHGEGEMKEGDTTFRGSWENGTRIGKGEITEPCIRHQTFVVEYEDGVEQSRHVKNELDANDLQEKLLRAQERIESMRNECREANKDVGSIVCKICYENQIDRVIKPCNHACMCGSCETKICRDQGRRGRFRCPICRALCHYTEEIRIG